MSEEYQGSGWHQDPGLLIAHQSFISLSGRWVQVGGTYHIWPLGGVIELCADLKLLCPVAGPQGSGVSCRGLPNSSKLITRVREFILVWFL